MPRWLVIILVVPLVGCGLCGTLGYFVGLPRIKSAVSDAQLDVADEMTDSLERTVTAKIQSSRGRIGRLELRAEDLNVNNVTFAKGTERCGFNYASGGTTIYGVVTEITATDVGLVCGVTYKGVPTIASGRFDLTNVTVSNKAAGYFFSVAAFERGLEDGINRALAKSGLMPTEIELRQDVMTIKTEPLTRPTSVA